MTVITVSQLNNYIKKCFDSIDIFTGICIKGEISNFKHHSSGHIYMTLKDKQSSLKCVMFSTEVRNLKFVPKDGMKVIAVGRISVYERDGVYQLYVNELIPDGKGDLYATFEQLKNELELLGYFDVSSKKTIPEYPTKVGIVTSKTGAALQDILNVSSRRYPICEIYVYPAQVQGVGAEVTIANGVEYFNNKIFPDVIICARGGGSIEDLWAFNERIVADSVYKSRIPVVSAVGHETDYTICDFVSDLRVPTPSAAAELIFPDKNKLLSNLANYNQRCKTALIANLNNKKFVLEKLIAKNMQKIIEDKLTQDILYLDSLKHEATEGIKRKIEINNNVFLEKCSNLDALSPIKVLSRGYSAVKTQHGYVRSIKDISENDNVNVILSDGNFEAKVINKS